MPEARFYDTGSRLLTPEAFSFLLQKELKRAIRAQNFVTLVALDTTRERKGLVFTADEATMRELAELVGREVRSTDLLGQPKPGTLSLVLLDADHEHARGVIDRLVGRIGSYQFPQSINIVMGAACYPTHAVDADGLLEEATSRPVVTWAPGSSGTPPL